jgi:hypothetical protein
MSTTTKLLLIANALCLMVFLALAFLLPLHGQSQAEARFTQLDKAGAVNHVGMAKMQLTRTNPGPWIAAPAITASRSAANIGIGLTLLNVSLFTAASMPKKK